VMGRWRDGYRALELEDDELILLDGRCRPEVQKYIDRLKSYRAKLEAGMPEYLASVLAEAERAMSLTAYHSTGSTCARCGAVGWFDPLYVRGPKKGQRNPRKKRVHHPRVKVLDEYFCADCWNNHVFEEIKAAIEPLYEVKIQDIETKAIIDYELECNRCKLRTWNTEVRSHRCPSPDCRDGYLQKPRDGESRLIEVAALKAARRMMEA